MKTEIILEDEQIIVCRKPAGIATQTKKLGQQDMESLLRNYRAAKGETPYIGLVHRLDQPVEGVMVFAKTREAAAFLSAQVRERTIGKHYYAIGIWNKEPETVGAGEGGSGKAAGLARQVSDGESIGDFPERGTLTDYVVVDRKANFTRIVEEKGQKAVLDYRMIGQQGREVLFDIALGTGRHHQIRAQLAHAGFPILGDDKYGAAAVGESGAGLAKDSIALCSYRLEFIHPATKKKVDISILPQLPCFEKYLKCKDNPEGEQTIDSILGLEYNKK